MAETHAVSIRVDLAKSRGAYRPLWNWIGYDEPNYTDTANGRKLLRELAELSPEPVRVRAHNLLTSGDGRYALKWGSTNAYTEDAAGVAVYDWTIMERIFDTYVEAGNIPSFRWASHRRRSRPIPGHIATTGRQKIAMRPSPPAGRRRRKT